MLGITIQPSFAHIRTGDILHCGPVDASSSDQGWFLENYLCQSLSWHGTAWGLASDRRYMASHGA